MFDSIKNVASDLGKLSGLRVLVNGMPEGYRQEPDKSNGRESPPWYAVAYDITLLTSEGRPILSTPYRMGLACIDLKKLITLTVKEACICEQFESRRYGFIDWYADSGNREIFLAAIGKLARNQHSKAHTLDNGERVRRWNKPEPDDVTYSLLSEGAAYFDAESHEDWCASLGYDSDSLKGLNTYRACVETGRQLVAGFGVERVAALREAFQNY